MELCRLILVCTVVAKADNILILHADADTCNEDLGMEDGTIQDFQITASSSLPRLMPSAARPWNVGWCAGVTDSKPWILVDLLAVTRVDGISIWTRGRSENITLYNSTGCLSFNLFYGVDTDDLVMHNDTDFHAHAHLMTDVQTFMLLNSIDARYIKLEIRNCLDNSNRCLRFELHGCKLADIPKLDCPSEYEMFELDREIRTEGNPIFYKNRNPHENCSSLCFRNESCSIVSYTKDEDCVVYPSSKIGMWQVTNNSTGIWSAKLCNKDYVELFPSVFNYNDFTDTANVEYIKQDAIIRSIGYPFSYGDGQNYSWIIKFPATRYVRIVFTNVSLSHEHEACHDRLLIGTSLRRLYREINHRYNGGTFVIETEEHLVVLNFNSCYFHRNVLNRRGLRAIVTGEKIRACLSIGLESLDWSDGRRRELCEKPNMILTSMSILNFPFESTQETWEIRVYTVEHYIVQLDILDFYVMCPQGDIRSMFAIFEMEEEKTFCNTDKPLDVIHSKTDNVIVTFRRHVDPKTVYLRTEGFRLRYSITHQALKKLNAPFHIGSKAASVISCKDWRLTENINLTFSGTSCQIWATLTTLAKDNFRSRFPDFGIPQEADNFCRDPDSSGILWCYTEDDRRHLWEPCFMQLTVSNMERQYELLEDSKDNSNSTFECGNGRSIYMVNRCDGVFDCNDFSDETSCRKNGQYLTNYEERIPIEKPPEKLERGPYFLCGSKEWISILEKCDDVINCVDASDELNCSNLHNEFNRNVFSCDDVGCDVCEFTSDYTTSKEELRELKPCESSDYECENKQCISMENRCNAISDCIDGSDENQCDSCKEGFHCDFAKCIPLRLRCDSVRDCEDGTDENSCALEIPFSLSSCDQWHERGYHTSENYVIDDISVYCGFTAIPQSGKITMSLRNIDVAIDGENGKLYTRSLSDNFVQLTTPTFRNLIYRDDYSCFLEVRKTCWFHTLASIIDGSADNDTYQECQCTVDTFKAERKFSSLKLMNEYNFVRNESFYCNGTEHPRDPADYVYYNVTGDGMFYIDGRIIKKEVPIQITPQQLICTYDYRKIWCTEERRRIPLSMLCIYDVDSAGIIIGCRSGSHLQNCGHISCPPNTVKCPESYCIALRFVCDGKVQCPGGEDEHGCTCTNTAREVLIFAEDVSDFRESTTAAVKLAEQLYTNGSDIRLLYYKTQVPLKQYDIEHRLLDIREEQNYTFQRLSSTKECRYKSMARNLLDQIQFATNHKKGIVFIEDSLESSKVAELMFSNLSNPTFRIYRVLKDANFTVRHDRPGTYKFVKDIPIHRWDALFFIGYKRFPEICQDATEMPCSGGYRCASSKQCIPLDQVCDGIAQCNGKDDERLCDLFCPRNCTCLGYSVSCRESNLNYSDIVALSKNTRIVDMSKNSALKDVLMNSSFRFSFMTKLNLSSCEIASVNKNGFSYLRNLKCLDIGYNRIKILPDNLFSTLEHLVFLNLDGNFELEEISSTAFRGLKSLRRLRITGTKIKRVSSFTFSYLTLQSIDISHNEITEIENYAFNGTSAKRIDFRGNNILTVNRMMFDGVSLLEELQTPAFKFCCIRPCYVDESNCFPPKNEFSSCEDLMRHPVLQAVLWIVGTIALLGNLGSIFYRIVYDRERLKIGYGIFVTNLAWADFLMGVYLIMIAIVDSFYRNRYIYFDDKWRSSAWCVTAGILSTVSSEASVLFVCFITLDRLLVIKYPFGTKRLEPRKAYVCCIMSWAVAFIIALFPVVYTGYFENRFYSRSAVCIALPLTRDKPPGWMYSVSIFVGLNFCTFLLVAFGQLSIFLELRKATSGIKKTPISRKRDLQVARNLIFVATTDFLCWFPIGLMGIMALSGYPIPGDVYAWTAVFILPLNSALNPVLYTLTAIIGKQSFNPNIEEQSRIEIQKEIASGILKHQDLLRSVQIKSGMAGNGQIVKDLLEKDEPIPTVTITAIAFQLSKYLCHLHESAIGIEQLSTDTTYVKVSKKKRHRVNIVLDSKLSISKDEKILQDNIYQFGILLRRLIAKRK